jgi:hypothetical protein
MPMRTLFSACDVFKKLNFGMNAIDANPIPAFSTNLRRE